MKIDATAQPGPEPSGIDDRMADDRRGTHVRRVVLGAWEGRVLMKVLGIPPQDLKHWSVRATGTHFHVEPGDRGPGLAVRKEEVSLLCTLCGALSNAVVPQRGKARERALKVTPIYLHHRVDVLLFGSFWEAALEKGPTLFHRFFSQAAADQNFADEFDRIFGEFSEAGGADFFFEVVDGLGVNFTLAQLLDLAGRMAREGRELSLATVVRDRHVGAINMILAKGSPFTKAVKDSIREEWLEIGRRADSDWIERRVTAARTSHERWFGGQFLGPSRPAISKREWRKGTTGERTGKAEPEAARYFGREAFYLMTFLIKKGLSERKASRLAARTLCLVCGDWYTEPKPQHLIKRYKYFLQNRGKDDQEKTARS